MTVWLTNKERFRREYFENSDKLETDAFRFGKGMAKLIEEGKHKELLPDLIVYSHPEYEINCEIEGVPMLSFLDSYDPGKNVFREFKTGRHPWTQSKVQKHDQLLVYATMLHQVTGNMPEYCDLDWIETVERNTDVNDFWHDNEKRIQVTGKIISFHREFDMREIERMREQIKRVAEEISEAYQSFIAEI